MKWSIILGLIFILACASGPRVYVKFHIPDIDRSGYNDSFYESGWNFLKIGDPRSALDYFEQSTVKDDKLHVGFGYAFLMQNKFGLAQRNFMRALELNPDNMQAEIGLSTMYEMMKQEEKAFQLYARLITKYPENAWIKVRYESIKSTTTEKFLKEAETHKIQGNRQKYIKSLEAAARFSPELTELQIQIGDFYFEEGPMDQCTVHYEIALKQQPFNESVLIKLGDAYEKLGKIDSALLVFNKLMEIKPGDPSIERKIDQLKTKFEELSFPEKFKSIFFNSQITREDLAALIGYYFDEYLTLKGTPEIITDIGSSFAREAIIKVSTLKIMLTRPDHTFDRFSKLNRSSFAVILNRLIGHLEKMGKTIAHTPSKELIEPADISPLYKHYKIIKFLVNAQFLNVDDQNNFNPTLDVSPPEAISAFKKLVSSLQ